MLFFLSSSLTRAEFCYVKLVLGPLTDIRGEESESERIRKGEESESERHLECRIGSAVGFYGIKSESETDYPTSDENRQSDAIRLSDAIRISDKIRLSMKSDRQENKWD